MYYVFTVLASVEANRLVLCAQVMAGAVEVASSEEGSTAQPDAEASAREFPQVIKVVGVQLLCSLLL
jgi:hypothetical protein